MCALKALPGSRAHTRRRLVTCLSAECSCQLFAGFRSSRSCAGCFGGSACVRCGCGACAAFSVVRQASHCGCGCFGLLGRQRSAKCHTQLFLTRAQQAYSTMRFGHPIIASGSRLTGFPTACAYPFRLWCGVERSRCHGKGWTSHSAAPGTAPLRACVARCFAGVACCRARGSAALWLLCAMPQWCLLARFVRQRTMPLPS
jgi:hypothetical protein